LRQMVAADVGITLMPVLAIKPPIAHTDNLSLRPFAKPAPCRTIALVWRRSSPLANLMKPLAKCLRNLPEELLQA
ncbi:MAG: LysR family hydrogen peroxide-inducible transcriptional activator, partial [Lysobacterales bacterium]